MDIQYTETAAQEDNVSTELLNKLKPRGIQPARLYGLGS